MAHKILLVAAKQKSSHLQHTVVISLWAHTFSALEAWIVSVFPTCRTEVLGRAAFVEPVYHIVLSLTQKSR